MSIEQEQEERELDMFMIILTAIMKVSKTEPGVVNIDGDLVMVCLARMMACVITMSPPEVQYKILDGLFPTVKRLIDQLRENPEVHPFRGYFIDEEGSDGMGRMQ